MTTSNPGDDGDGAAPLGGTLPAASLETWHEPRDDADRGASATLRPMPQAPWTTLDVGALPLLPTAGDGRADIELVDELGAGAMGVVHLGRQASLGRDVAVKRLHPGASRQHMAALVAEARTVGMLEHPAIPPVHALCHTDGVPMLVMKRIEGVDWRALLDDPDHPGWGPTAWADEPPLLRNLQVLLRVADAARFAHSRGFVHRDIKPRNVMVGAFGEVYLLDWGVAARLEAVRDQPGALVGTPFYMAPEMLDGLADERTDVFLLGAVLHRVLTGRPRHAGGSVDAVLEAVDRCVPQAYGPDVPPTLAALANAATARDPADRPPDVEAFQAALRAVLKRWDADQMVAAAGARLARGLGLLQDPTPSEGAEAAVALAEARFGYQQALRVVPDHAEAQAGLVQAAEVAADLALRRGDLDGATALIGDLAHVLPSVDARLRLLEQRRARLARIQARAAAFDPEIARGPRTAFIAGSAAAMLGVAWAVSASSGGFGMAVWASGNVAVFSVIASVLGRRALLRHGLTRRVVLFIVLGSVAVFVHRVMAAAMGQTLQEAMTVDLLIAAAIAGAAALTVSAWVWVLALLALVAAVGTLRWPEHTGAIVGTNALLAMAFGVWRWQVARRDAEPAAALGPGARGGGMDGPTAGEAP